MSRSVDSNKCWWDPQPYCECQVCEAARAREDIPVFIRPTKTPTRELPPSMRPLPMWQWVAGTIAFLVIVLILLIGGQ